MSNRFHIEGLDDLQQKLQALANPKKVRNAANRSLRKAANVVRDAARENAKSIDDPETKEKIWKNIGVQAGKARDKNYVIMRIGVRGGASFSNPNPPKLSGGDTRHWRFEEYGSVHNAPNPFMRTALANNIQQVTDTFVTAFNAELDLMIVGT